MSAKYKPKKKEAEPVVDDWEASDLSDGVEDGEERSNKAKTSTIAAIKVEEKKKPQDAWDEEDNDYSRRIAASSSSTAQVNGRTLWEEA